jgi:hypothetical protein
MTVVGGQPFTALATESLEAYPPSRRHYSRGRGADPQRTSLFPRE